MKPILAVVLVLAFALLAFAVLRLRDQGSRRSAIPEEVPTVSSLQGSAVDRGLEAVGRNLRTPVPVGNAQVEFAVRDKSGAALGKVGLLACQDGPERHQTDMLGRLTLSLADLASLYPDGILFVKSGYYCKFCKPSSPGLVQVILEQSFDVAFRVVDQSSRPIPGALIEASCRPLPFARGVRPGSRWPCSDEYALSHRRETDSDGVATLKLPAGRVFLNCSADGYWIHEVSQDPIVPVDGPVIVTMLPLYGIAVRALNERVRHGEAFVYGQQMIQSEGLMAQSERIAARIGADYVGLFLAEPNSTLVGEGAQVYIVSENNRAMQLRVPVQPIQNLTLYDAQFRDARPLTALMLTVRRPAGDVVECGEGVRLWLRDNLGNQFDVAPGTLSSCPEGTYELLDRGIALPSSLPTTRTADVWGSIAYIEVQLRTPLFRVQISAVDEVGEQYDCFYYKIRLKGRSGQQIAGFSIGRTKTMLLPAFECEISVTCINGMATHDSVVMPNDENKLAILVPARP
ncbi:MAG: carboxypeptidase-like regulatory domain-containing protein [Planctomycetes bacterium]|jgi:hypothetical protein|nr:carboxypeptidase-like regulatory domain-containing protein [Planctomycetota bacterium]